MERRDALVALSGLAHESRLDVYRLLVEAGPAGISAGQIGEALALAPATLSFHLNHLKHAGLVSCRRNGRSLIYVADFARMNGLIGYLTENCCQGQQERCDFTARNAKSSIHPRKPTSENVSGRARRRVG